MKTKLNSREYVTVASMLFGMFFGAGNLIFPVYMGQQAGSHVWAAVAGFLITGVGMPLLGVAALGLSRSSTACLTSRSKVNRPYAYVFHLPAVSDDRAVLRHPALRDDILHRRVSSRSCRRAATRGSIFCCSRSIFFAVAFCFSRSSPARF